MKMELDIVSVLLSIHVKALCMSPLLKGKKMILVSKKLRIWLFLPMVHNVLHKRFANYLNLLNMVAMAAILSINNVFVAMMIICHIK